MHGVQGLEGAVGLKVLGLSFNELSSMEGLAHLTRLTRLDLSFNAIPAIQCLKVPTTHFAPPCILMLSQLNSTPSTDSRCLSLCACECGENVLVAPLNQS